MDKERFPTIDVFSAKKWNPKQNAGGKSMPCCALVNLCAWIGQIISSDSETRSNSLRQKQR